jgi:hypothetical protein
MTTVQTLDPTTTVAPAAGPARSHPVRRAALTSGAVAAVATTAVAATASAADVPFEIDGEAIPLLGFAQMTLLGAVVGGLLLAALNRWSTNARSRFVTAAVALTALSCIPSVAMPPDTASKIVLVATHVLAAVLVVPALARQARS